MAYQERKEVLLCFSERWEDGLVVSGGYSTSSTGRAILLFASDKDRMGASTTQSSEDDSNADVESDEDAVPLTPFPGTDPLGPNGKINKRAKSIVMRQTDVQDETVEEAKKAQIYAIGHSSDSIVCPLTAPTCDKVDNFDPSDTTQVTSLAGASGIDAAALEDLIKLSNYLDSVPGTGGTGTGDRKRQNGSQFIPSGLLGTSGEPLQSCYLIQKDPLLVRFTLKPSFQWAALFGELGGARDLAFFIGGLVATLSSLAGLRGSSKPDAA